MEEMEKRENAVRLWFDMWLRQEDLGIRALFAEDAVYVESWGAISGVSFRLSA